ncbi:alpha/beta-hydrolase [Gautieria morchelliformis]|nr:alpha/beta-hydrolase [Gautieria morchelliformis]
MPFLHRQPWKCLYLLYLATKVIFVKLPYWSLISLSPSWRPFPSWGLRKCLGIYTLRSVIDLLPKLGVRSKRDLSVEVPDSSTLRNAKFAWIDGVDEDSLQGKVRQYAETADVKPTRVPGYWQFREGWPGERSPKAKEGEEIVYHLHGGAFFVGSAHPSDPYSRIPRGILKHSTTISRSFAVDYRTCASSPFPAENAFPSALLDCIAGYQYLMNLGFLPKNIVLVGDSAGGNLALALTRYLTENAVPNSAPPGRLILLSLWGDLSASRVSPTSSLVVNWASDIFPSTPPTAGGFGAYGAKAYFGTAFDSEEIKLNPYISPASPHLTQTHGMFKAFPRTYILAGGLERLLDDSKVIAERMKADNTSDGWVTLDVVEDAVHDFIIFSWTEPERSEALVRISRWLDQD